MEDCGESWWGCCRGRWDDLSHMIYHFIFFFFLIFASDLHSSYNICCCDCVIILWSDEIKSMPR
jgi:hypothetical protein